MRKLADALGILSTDLTGETFPSPRAIVVQGVAHVPIVRRVHASAQPWAGTGETTPIPEIPGKRPSDLLAAVVTGDCMSPEVEPGDIVVWDRTMRSPQDGDMVVVSVDGECLVKRAYRDSAGVYVLAANNGQVMIPSEGMLEGVVIAISKRPRRRPFQMG